MSTANPQTAVVPAGAAGTVQKQEFGSSQLETLGETSTAVMAAQAEAMVKARFTIAMRRPRDWDDVRTKLLRSCERPGFAGSATEKSWGAAWYRKPVGEGVEGFSIRFAEEALRCMGNIDVETLPLFEDDGKRILRVTVLDLESNISIPTSVTVEKTVTRRFLKKGEEALRVTVNSKGETTYLLRASEDEVFSKQQNLASKAIRNGVLRLLPGDIQAECRERILAIRKGEAVKDPDGFRRKVADGFASLNVLPSALKEYLGHALEQSSPAELTDLRDLWKAIEEGKTTWAEALAAELEGRGQAPTAEPEKKAGLAGLTEKLQQQTGTQAAGPECAGCGKNDPACDAQDDEGRAFHGPCLEVLKKQQAEDAKRAAAEAKPATASRAQRRLAE